ncbi:MAG: cytochrome c5 family protein, partial [Rhizobacter sp.]
KGAMGAQGGGDFGDLEIARAVVYMANKSGGKLEEPKVPAPAASAAK